jgi:predicted amidohydrolase
MTDNLKIGLCQMLVTSVKEDNIRKAVNMIEQSVEKGAQLVILPECFNSPYGTKYFSSYAEPISLTTGETCMAISDAAKKNKVWVIAGSIPEIDGDKYYNTSVTFTPDGSLYSTYRKMHLFKINTEKVQVDESLVLSPGANTNTINIDNTGWKIGMGICFDIRFPLLAYKYLEQGTNMLVYPGAFNIVTGPVHWELAARSRAVDTQQYVCVCSPARDTSADYIAYGHSSIIDPFGTVIATCDETEQIVIGDISLQKVIETRGILPIVSGIRWDLK